MCPYRNNRVLLTIYNFDLIASLELRNQCNFKQFKVFGEGGVGVGVKRRFKFSSFEDNAPSLYDLYKTIYFDES